MQYPTERELLEMVKRGNEKAFTILYKQYQPLMFKFAFGKLQNKEEAEDVVQEIFTSFWQRRNELSLKTQVKFYFLRAVHLQYAQKCRHAVVIKKYQETLNKGKKDYEIPVENKELFLQIKTAINSISAPACRKVFEMAYLENQSCHYIAAKMKIKPQVVRNQTSRALKVVREHLKFVV